MAENSAEVPFDLSAPRRRFRIELDLQADSMHDLTDALYDIATDLMHAGVRRRVSGGVSTGYRFDITEDEAMTTERYRAESASWLERQRALRESDSRPKS